MKFKLKWCGKLVFEIFTLLILLSGAAQATVNGSISISDNSGIYKVLGQAGGAITPNPETIAPTNFLFFNSSPAPNAAVTTFIPSGYSTYRAAGDFNVFRYDFAGTGSVYVLALAADGLHYRIINTGNYYTGTAWASSNLALSATEAKDYFISGTTDHLKAVPYAPTISIQEAQTRIEETPATETTLTVRVSAVSGSSPNIIDVGGNTTGTYAVEIVKAGDAAPVVVGSANNVIGPSLINQSGEIFTLKGPYFVAGATYNIRAWNRNWFSSIDDAANKVTDDWTLLGGSGVPGTLSTTVSFSNGLNFFSLGMPAGGGNWYVGTTAFNTVGGLITALGGPTRVSTFGYVDNSGNLVGVKVNAEGTDFDETGLALSTPLSATQGYQVYMKGLTVPLVLTISN